MPIMASYGKKKRGVWGKFSGFPDNTPKSAGEESPGKSSCVTIYLKLCLINSVKAIHG